MKQSRFEELRQKYKVEKAEFDIPFREAAADISEIIADADPSKHPFRPAAVEEIRQKYSRPHDESIRFFIAADDANAMLNLVTPTPDEVVPVATETFPGKETTVPAETPVKDTVAEPAEPVAPTPTT